MPLKRPFPFAPTTTRANWLSPRIHVFAGRTLRLGTRGIVSGMVVDTSRKPLNKRMYVKRHNVPLCCRSVRLFVLCFRRLTPCISIRYPLYIRTSRVANLTVEIMDTCTVMVKLCRRGFSTLTCRGGGNIDVAEGQPPRSPATGCDPRCAYLENRI